MFFWRHEALVQVFPTVLCKKHWGWGSFSLQQSVLVENKFMYWCSVYGLDVLHWSWQCTSQDCLQSVSWCHGNTHPKAWSFDMNWDTATVSTNIQKLYNVFFFGFFLKDKKKCTKDVVLHPHILYINKWNHFETIKAYCRVTFSSCEKQSTPFVICAQCL